VKNLDYLIISNGRKGIVHTYASIHLFSLILVLMFAILPAQIVKATNYYYVSTTGNDSTGDGTITNPWKTIQCAANVAQAGDIVIIRGGTYRETITPVNSGTLDSPITFASASGENVIINGCDIVTGWTQYNGNIYQASMPWTMGKGKDEVFVDGNVLIQARYPNTNAVGKYYPQSLNLSPLWPVLGDFNSVYQSSPSEITSSTLLNQSTDDYWNGAIYNGGHGWNWCWQSGIVDTSTYGSFTVMQKTRQWWFNLNNYNYFPENQQGFITDSMNCLNYAGAWQNNDNTLYLWTTDSTNPSSHIVEAKKRQLAFDLRNKSYINLTGINVFAGSITMYNANNCTIDNCKLSYISHFMLWDDSHDGYIDDYTLRTNNSAPQRGEVGIYVGGQNNTISNSTICYSSGAGLFVTGLNCTITNNNIHDCGYASTYLGCVFISYEPESGLNDARGGHTITYNNIYNAGRSGIGFSAVPSQATPYYACEIANNRIHDTCLLAQDGGAIYSYNNTLNSNGQRTQIHNNLIYNNWAKYAGSIIYSDNYTYGIDCHDNILWQEPFPNVVSKNNDGFTFGNTPNDTVFTNNIKKVDYLGGITGLSLNDYPNQVYFQSGSNHDDNGNIISVQVTPLPVGPLTLQAESFSSMNGVTQTANYVGSCDNGDWICFNNVTLGTNGYNQLAANVAVPDEYAGGQVEIRLDSLTGTLVGNLTVQSTGSWYTYAQQAISLTGATGTHNVYFKFTGSWGVGVFDYFRFQTAPLTVQAEGYNSMNGITQGATCIGSCDNGDWICFNNIDLGSGYSKIIANAAVTDEYAGGKVEVRLDSTTGTLLGTLSVQSTGAWNIFTEQALNIYKGTGTHNIHILFKNQYGVGNFDYFIFK